MYIIETTNEQVKSFMEAIKIATSNNCKVIDAALVLLNLMPLSP